MKDTVEMENDEEERRTIPEGDAGLDNDCGKLGDNSSTSSDSKHDLGARCKSKSLSYNIPSAGDSSKLNNNSEHGKRTRRRRRAPSIDKVNRAQRKEDVISDEISESESENVLDGKSNGEMVRTESKSYNSESDKTVHVEHKLDSYLRNNVAGFEPYHNKCPDKKEDLEAKANLSSDSDNDGDVEEEDEEDDGLSADECCIYTYRGDREGAADLPPLFGADGQDADCAVGGEGMVNLGRRPGEVPRSRCSSPEMDFLEMDFDPGPPTGRDSDESGQESQGLDDEGNMGHPTVKQELPTANPCSSNSAQKSSNQEESPQAVPHCSLESTSSQSTTLAQAAAAVSEMPNSLALLHGSSEQSVGENAEVVVESNSCITPRTNPPTNVDVSKGAVPKIPLFNLAAEPVNSSNANLNSDTYEGCRRRQCLDGLKQGAEKSARGLFFAGVNGCESIGGSEHIEAIIQPNVVDSAVNSPSYYVPVFICLPKQTYSPSKSQPKLLQIHHNSTLAHCRGHRKFHGDHSSYVADRGTADVIVNALSALDVSVPYGKVQQGLCLAMPNGYPGNSVPPNGLVEYLEWRANCKGAPSQVEVAHSIEWASEGAVVSRFFPAAPSPVDFLGTSARYCSATKSFTSSCALPCSASASASVLNKAQVAGVNLMDWLYYWMKRGAVPIVTLNSQDWVDCIKTSGVENPDHNRMCGFSERSGVGANVSRGGIEEGERWVHQMVVGLGPRGAYLSGCANEQCCAEVRSLACLLVSGETKGVRVGRAEIVARAVVSTVRESCASMPRSSSSSSASTSSSSSASATPPAMSPASPLGLSATPSATSPPSNSPFITLPVARHRTGITLVLPKDSHALEELLAAPETALSQILCPSSGNTSSFTDSASSALTMPSMCIPPVNGKASIPAHASLSMPPTRSQDSA
ncbi:hypothetical protein J437_LFUL018118 [Ladona fulva]|uniref:Uncharacterized protein n=1 Tax=Ladona fulva TaxID=123851 RepID=A0A8K0KC40_LADFU|nr:hypothetical protein J437_LFUL018118 [Ladona fulva]